jgi:hypothetical protein
VHRRNKLGAAAMHRDHHAGRQPLKLRDRVIDIILRRWAEMKPAEDRMQLGDPGHSHRGLYRVDQSDMAARGDDDEPASPNDIAGRVFVWMLVWYEIPAAPPR